MKRIYSLLTFMLIAGFCVDAQVRYVDEVFSDYEQQDSIIYGSNTTILPLLEMMPPVRRPLFVNVLTPSGDTETNRPLILLFHTGNFLPRLINGNNNGRLDDPYIVELAGRMTKMGYVVGIVDYRKGWNPLGTQDQRTNTLINAAYRGVQDATTCVRYFRKSIRDFGNPYGIADNKIVAWGVGTGGYISMAASTLDAYEDVLLPKFIGEDINGDGLPDPMVIDFINGDPFALEAGVNPLSGDTLCYPNHTDNLSSEIQLCVNMGGALGDSTWINAGDPPMLSFHVPTDPFAPYTEGTVRVPTTGDAVVDVIGSYETARWSTLLGNNDVWNNSIFNDVYSDVANSRNDGLEGLFPMPRPDWDLTVGPVDDGMDNPTNVEASPWEFWDATMWSTAPFGQATLDGPGQPCDMIPIEFCNWHLAQSGSNPDMSFDKATAYQDSILGYFGPRACVALELDCARFYSSTEDILDENLVSVSPNPATNQLFVKSTDEPIIGIELTDVQGRLVKSITGLNDFSYKLDGIQEATGMHVLTIRFSHGLVTKKIILE